MKVDYIIVGSGLAGMAFAEILVKNKKSFVVYEDSSQNSSLVAGGMYNPVILKRFTPVWNAREQLNYAHPFYKELEKRFNKKFHYPFEIVRIFKSIEEQNNWFTASDRQFLKEFMIPKIKKIDNANLNAPFQGGTLKNTGRYDVKLLLNTYRKSLVQNSLLRVRRFVYDKIKFNKSKVDYEDIQAKKIVFCEGFGLKKNPFFNDLPMNEAKGELLTIFAPDLKIDFLIKSSIFILPLGDDLYKVGATFNWQDKSEQPTKEGRAELESKLTTVIKCDYKIVDHVAGIRPTIKDRRPLIGVHKKHKQLAILNGLGTRGVIIAPLMAKKLFQHIENSYILEKEIDISRFDK